MVTSQKLLSAKSASTKIERSACRGRLRIACVQPPLRGNEPVKLLELYAAERSVNVRQEEADIGFMQVLVEMLDAAEIE